MAFEPNTKSAGECRASPDALNVARQLAAIVSSAFAVQENSVFAAARGGKSTAFARQVAMYLSHTHLGLSYTAAGAVFGRDRTTAAYACRTVEEKREDAEVDAIVDCVERVIDRMPGFGRDDGDAV